MTELNNRKIALLFRRGKIDEAFDKMLSLARENRISAGAFITSIADFRADFPKGWIGSDHHLDLINRAKKELPADPSITAEEAEQLVARLREK